jgi:aldehyde dehydrogenase (NAD+)
MGVQSPVMQILKFKDTDDVISRANDTSYGLAAGVFTYDTRVAIRVSNEIQAGTGTVSDKIPTFDYQRLILIVWINDYFFMDVSMPFGGYKMSGIGREMGEECLRYYTETKTVLLNFA